MQFEEIHNSAEMVDLIDRIGFLPLLDSGIRGFSAEEMVDEDCRYVVYADGGWDWPLWKWKGEIITEGGHVYGKFFNGKAGFISRKWWPDFCNYRRSVHPKPEEDSIEDTILMILSEHESLITRELRALCGFDGPRMRSRFDGYVTRLQMATRIVTQDFVYAQDRHGREYGWGLSLLTTPEQLYGREECRCDRTPQESLARIIGQLKSVCPDATHSQLLKLAQ